MTGVEKVNLSSLKLVQDELIATIEQSAVHLEQFASERNNAELLQSCIDGIKQISGTLSLLQLKGVDLLAQELVEHITDIPLGEEPNSDRQLDVLTSAFFILPRYLEYCLQTSRSMAMLLIPYINELRQIRKAPLLPESHFYVFDIPKVARTEQQSAAVLGEDLNSVVRRLRHMYQVGLLKVLQGKGTGPALSMMARSMERLDSACVGYPMGELWRVGSAFLEAAAEKKLHLTMGRKRLLSTLDREVKKVQAEGKSALDKAPDPALLKEMLYLVALSRSDAPKVVAVAKAYGVEHLPYNDAELIRELEFLKGPSANTIDSMSAVLKDELRSTKNILERAAQGGTELLNESPELLDTLKKVADILAVVGLVSASNSLRQEIQKIAGWQEGKVQIDPEELLAVADTLLYIESSVSGLGKTSLSDERLAEINATSRHDIIAHSQLAEAEQLVFEEAESGLSLVKRALSSFAESNYDVGHIKNVANTLNSVRGGMTLLNLPRAAALVSACVRFVEQSLLQNEQPAAVQHMLETFADAVISLEYYLDTIKYERDADDSVLKVAEESVEALGYPVR
ncbi:pilus assembly protein [Marinimicrobium sp. ABcell2]|uniref:pilus assembly protein n=1 Tax=Marinimicrobium sp. ABcell2 TaxID=3069751 RepID=UPI0027B25EFC|nr:pilus assembly protein [Marinimicrobium sp. ABcell2]MDQ2075708.1 pilus assembly protein [Marinimicrobium sp. ABcell2]